MAAEARSFLQGAGRACIGTQRDSAHLALSTAASTCDNVLTSSIGGSHGGRGFCSAAGTAFKRERKLAHRLAQGYHLLADGKCPGSKSAQLDLIVVGPSGVWIVDSKHGNDFTIAGGSIFRGEATDDVLRLADVAESAFAEVGLAPDEVYAFR